MSLDVYLVHPQKTERGSGIFVREAGGIREISRAEWDEKFPGLDPVVSTTEESDHSYYHANITHNLGKMAQAAGIYAALWRPEEIGIQYAYQLIDVLSAGLILLIGDPAYFRKFDPPNGWGDYGGLVQFVNNYLNACKAHPEAEIRVSR